MQIGGPVGTDSVVDSGRVRGPGRIAEAVVGDLGLVDPDEEAAAAPGPGLRRPRRLGRGSARGRAGARCLAGRGRGRRGPVQRRGPLAAGAAAARRRVRAAGVDARRPLAELRSSCGGRDPTITCGRRRPDLSLPRLGPRHPLFRQADRELAPEAGADPHRVLACRATLDQRAKLREVEHDPRRRRDLEVGGVELGAAQGALLDQPVDVIEVLGQRGKARADAGIVGLGGMRRRRRRPAASAALSRQERACWPARRNPGAVRCPARAPIGTCGAEPAGRSARPSARPPRRRRAAGGRRGRERSAAVFLLRIAIRFMFREISVIELILMEKCIFGPRLSDGSRYIAVSRHHFFALEELAANHIVFVRSILFHFPTLSFFEPPPSPGGWRYSRPW